MKASLNFEKLIFDFIDFQRPFDSSVPSSINVSILFRLEKLILL